LLFPAPVREASSRGAISCRERLGGLLKYYSCAAWVFSPYAHHPGAIQTEHKYDMAFITG